MRDGFEKIVMDRLAAVALQPMHVLPEWEVKNRVLQQRCQALLVVLEPRHLDLKIVDLFPNENENEGEIENEVEDRDKKSSGEARDSVDDDNNKEQPVQVQRVQKHTRAPASDVPPSQQQDIPTPLDDDDAGATLAPQKEVADNKLYDSSDKEETVPSKPLQSVCPTNMVLDVIAGELRKIGAYNSPNEILLQVHLCFEMVSRAVVSASRSVTKGEAASGADDLLPVFILVRGFELCKSMSLVKWQLSWWLSPSLDPALQRCIHFVHPFLSFTTPTILPFVVIVTCQVGFFVDFAFAINVCFSVLVLLGVVSSLWLDCLRQVVIRAAATISTLASIIDFVSTFSNRNSLTTRLEYVGYPRSPLLFRLRNAK